MGSRPAEVAVGVPALAPERQVTWPKRTRTRLANGLEVILAESHTIPKFHGELLFRSGNAAAADRSIGLAEMTAIVLRSGTRKRASRKIEEDLRRIGADLSAHAGSDASAISFRSEEHTSELQSRLHLVCRLLLEKKKDDRGQSLNVTDKTIMERSRLAH